MSRDQDVLDRPGVLVVDDVPANLIAIDGFLRDLDCDVVLASSGNDALRHLLRQDFAAMLLDVQMPEMDGFEVARLARSSPRSSQVPIIFVTAMSDTHENLFRGYESGAVDVLFKPLDPHVLLSKVRVFLELDRSTRRLAREIEAHKRTLADLEAFNYSVAHDLRAPLRPLAGFSKILLQDHSDQLDEDARGLLHRISAAAQRMDRLIDDLLQLSRIGRARPKRLAVNLGAVAHSIVAELRRADPERHVDFVCPEQIQAIGDESLLRIALENLLRNAWKFTGKTSAARIEIAALRKDGETVFSVADNGVGFDQDHAVMLFKPFHRLHSRDEFEGTGIGLAIVQRVIAHHGGRLWGRGEPKRGATFSFTLG